MLVENIITHHLKSEAVSPWTYCAEEEMQHNLLFNWQQIFVKRKTICAENYVFECLCVLPHDSITQLLLICWLHIHDTSLLLNWDLVSLEAIWVWWTVSYSRSVPRFDRYYQQDNAHSHTWSATMAVHLVLKGTTCAKKISLTRLHHCHNPESLVQGWMNAWFHVVDAIFWP